MKTERLNMCVIVSLMALFTSRALVGSAATPTVSNVTAKQRYPWNGMVDITCTVSGISGTTKSYEFVVAAVNSGSAYGVSQFWVVRNGTNSADRVVHTNGIYHLVWDSKTDFDNQICSNMVMRVNLALIHDKVQLWANGPYWATTNVGAEEPYESGYYFWWGDTVGYKCVNNTWVASDGSSVNFSFNPDNTPTMGKGLDSLRSEGWITADGVLAPEHDAAHVHWGGNWHMPTNQEFRDLGSNCDWRWTTMNRVKGYVVRGRGDYASNSIFLPCCGCGNGTSLGDSQHGFYWTSVTYTEIYTCYLHFYSLLRQDTSFHYRSVGYSVRPVQEFTK